MRLETNPGRRPADRSSKNVGQWDLVHDDAQAEEEGGPRGIVEADVVTECQRRGLPAPACPHCRNGRRGEATRRTPEDKSQSRLRRDDSETGIARTRQPVRWSVVPRSSPTGSTPGPSWPTRHSRSGSLARRRSTATQARRWSRVTLAPRRARGPACFALTSAGNVVGRLPCVLIAPAFSDQVAAGKLVRRSTSRWRYDRSWSAVGICIPRPVTDVTPSRRSHRHIGPQTAEGVRYSRITNCARNFA